MLKNNTPTRKLTFAAMMLALSALFGALFHLEFAFGGITGLKLGLAQLPVLFGSIVLGPVYGVLLSVCSDFINVLTSSNGAYQPLFAISAALFGAIPALFLHNRPGKLAWLRMYIVFLLIQTLTSTLLNTFFIHFLYGVPIRGLFWLRLPALVVDPVLFTLLCYPLLRLCERMNLIEYVPQRKPGS